MKAFIENKILRWRAALKLKRSITFDLSVSLVTVVCLTMIVVSGMNCWILSIHEKRYFKEKAEDYVHYLKESLELPLWSLDGTAVEKICGAFFLKNETVARLTVCDPQGQIIFDRRQDGISDVTRDRHVITYKGSVIGQVDISLAANPSMERTLYLIQLSLTTLIATLLILLISTRFFLRKFLNRPMAYLIQRISALADGDFRHVLTPPPQAELRDIVFRFNRMAAEIERREEALKTVNQELTQEISERKATEERLKTSERRMAQIIDFLPDPTFVIDHQSRVIAWNRAIARLTGIPAEDMIGRGDYAYATPFYGKPRPIMIDLVRSWDETIAQTYRHITRKQDAMVSETVNPPFRDGYFWNVASPLYDETGHAVGAIETIRDITEIRLAEEETRRLRSYLSNLINSMPSILAGVDRGLRITQWNAAAEKETGLSPSEARGRPVEEVLPFMRPQMDSVSRAMTERAAQTCSKIPCGAADRPRYQDMTVFPLADEAGELEGAVIRLDDVTERARMEEMVIQSEKMLMVGGLAAGMAHEINTPLAAVLHTVQNLERRLLSDLPANVRAAEACGLPLETMVRYLERREIPRFLADIRSAGHRASEIVRNMLDFSRKADSGGSTVHLAELLDRTLTLAANDYDLKKNYDFRRIEIIRDYQPDAPPVVCHSAKIQQVFFNILHNGAYAMRENRDADRPSRFILRVVSEGKMVRVDISDNGPGMDEATRNRVFEPFFTTKPPGIGTGLGLSISYFIITENHGGTLSVESGPGRGTVFTIRLPVNGSRKS